MAMEEDVSDYLKQQYNYSKHPGAFCAIRRNAQYKVSRAKIKQFLQGVEHYTIQKQSRRKFPGGQSLHPT